MDSNDALRTRADGGNCGDGKRRSVRCENASGGDLHLQIPKQAALRVEVFDDRFDDNAALCERETLSGVLRDAIENFFGARLSHLLFGDLSGEGFLDRIYSALSRVITDVA